MIDMTPPLTGFTAPLALGSPEAGGYYLLKPGRRVR